MKKYWSLLRVRFINGLQYRTAAAAGISTQFVWGFMELLMFRAFYQADAAAFPMSFEALASYIWLQQASLALFMPWAWDMSLFDSITNGDVAYELCRPVRLYNMWFVKTASTRLSKTALRCAPVLLVASLLPRPYRLTLPVDWLTLLWFLISMLLAFLVLLTFCMVIYMTAFYTISSQGIRMVVTSLGEFLNGSIIPLPFLPDGVRRIVSMLPFASMQNVPFRIYSHDLWGREMYLAIGLQVFWLAVLWTLGRTMEAHSMKRVIVQGG